MCASVHVMRVGGLADVLDSLNKVLDVNLDVNKHVEHLQVRLCRWYQTAVPVMHKKVRPQRPRLR